jgi:rare lipoprotein A
MNTGTMNRLARRTLGAASMALVLICSPATRAADAVTPGAAPAAAAPAASSTGAAETGLAAVYSDRLHGRPTASGERYDRGRLTAAHKTLPFGTQVRVTNSKNQKSITVRINDRGPMQAGRILDLSPTAARAIGIGPRGMAEVTAEVVGEAPKVARK